jgi:predicted component of type VI protein secretion system
LLKTEGSNVEDVSLTVESFTQLSDASLNSRTLGDFPMASSSVLSYGLAAHRGAHGEKSSEPDLAKAIKAAIQRFECRILPTSVRVNASKKPAETAGETDSGIVEFEIRGIVRMKPVSEELMLKAIYQSALAQWRIEGPSL